MERREALKLSAALMGTGISGMVFSGMLQGCRVDTSREWEPVSFSREQADVVAEMAEHILPRTDTPGAKDVLVDRFMDKLIHDCYTEETRKDFLSGLKDFENACTERFGKGFSQCSEGERDAILEEQEAIPYVPAMYLWGNKVKDEGETSFYRQFKGLVLFGYFSSEEVGKNVLNYDPIPGKFIGCMPLSEVGSAWTL
jgi:hypothetical protein